MKSNKMLYGSNKIIIYPYCSLFVNNPVRFVNKMTQFDKLNAELGKIIKIMTNHVISMREESTRRSISHEFRIVSVKAITDCK